MFEMLGEPLVCKIACFNWLVLHGDLPKTWKLHAPRFVSSKILHFKVYKMQFNVSVSVSRSGNCEEESRFRIGWFARAIHLLPLPLFTNLHWGSILPRLQCALDLVSREDCQHQGSVAAPWNEYGVMRPIEMATLEQRFESMTR